jgi:hypothetical protein
LHVAYCRLPLELRFSLEVPTIAIIRRLSISIFSQEYCIPVFGHPCIMSILFMAAIKQMYESEWIMRAQHMKLFNTSVLLASTMCELADAQLWRGSTQGTLGFGHDERTFMQRMLWPNGPEYTDPCPGCDKAYCVCAHREPGRPLVSMSWLCGCRLCSRLTYLSHVRTTYGDGQPYTPTLSPAYSYSSAFANMANSDNENNDGNDDNNDGNEDGSGETMTP